jgi:iron complex transport system substrate-binding protein
MILYKNRIFPLVLLLAGLGACQSSSNQDSQPIDKSIAQVGKIVSLNGTVSEILAALELEEAIVGTDVTSTYPVSLQSKPKLGHNRSINVEGILSLQPEKVIALTSDIKPEVVEQLKTAGVKVQLFDREYSIDGTRQLIRQIADSLGRQTVARQVIEQMDQAIASVKTDTTNAPKVLFIYARGSGTMMVGGEGTAMEKMIQLAGGRNAVAGFTDFKPLTSEALVAANPDVILLFDSGLESLGGADAIYDVQGIKETNAGKNKKVVTMDGALLSGFGPRVPEAIKELSGKIH